MSYPQGARFSRPTCPLERHMKMMIVKDQETLLTAKLSKDKLNYVTCECLEVTKTKNKSKNVKNTNKKKRKLMNNVTESKEDQFNDGLDDPNVSKSSKNESVVKNVSNEKVDK